MMARTSCHIARGFADPVRDSQRNFRHILAALSQPGTVKSLDVDIDPPDRLALAASIILLVLTDHDTPLWMPPQMAHAAAYIRFHTGAQMAPAPDLARFAVIDGGIPSPDLSIFDAGNDRYPDRSATVIVQCAALSGGPAVTLVGPGIDGRCAIAPRGLHPRFWSEVTVNARRYPLGIDLILASGRDIIGLPRSTSVAPMAEVG
jgi:alpha-D-ribose 1-methylphosphonate 5-triphosphate synthase subunit PhnH